MPSRFLEKNYTEESFYHVFNRGVEKRDIFIDGQDYRYFLGLLERYLQNEPATDKTGRSLPNYSKEIELLAYCLMPNHIHLLVYQIDKDAMQKFMRSLCTSYSMYFNKKYKRVGKLFQDRYKAVLVDEEGYFTHISRYIHLNPLDVGKDYKTYPYSSLKYWIGDEKADWLKPEKGVALFGARGEYGNFLEDYEEHKAELDEIKGLLKE
ncbi:MAG: transposase [Patescibacteria group bacterium]